MQIAELHLVTNHLSAQRAFYHKLMEFPLVAETPTSFTVQVGASTITFGETAEPLPSIYHVAFNIPENQLAAAKIWLGARAPLLQNGDSDEWHFADWNAHAIYYLDPAGNILEFIARHNLPTAGDRTFDWQSLLSVSEIGLATPNVSEFLQQLKQKLGLTLWRGNETDFAAVGDEQGLLIVAVNGRPWNGNASPAQPLPTKIVLREETAQRVIFAGLPYEVVIIPSPCARWRSTVALAKQKPPKQWG